MRRSVVGVILALVLAAIGTVALVLYVSRAEERAREGEELVEVYVVDSLIPAGTPSEQIEDALRVEEVPLKVRPDNSVDNLADIAGQVSGVDLVPGEQLLSSRFVTQSDFVNRQVGVDVPDEKIEITIALDPERAIGGHRRRSERDGRRLHSFHVASRADRASDDTCAACRRSWN